MGILTAAELAGLEFEAARFYTTPVQIQRSVSGVYTLVLATQCTFAGQTGTVSLTGVPAALAPVQWLFTLAASTDVREGDRLVLASGTYAVQRAITAGSDAPETTVYAFQLFDALGNVVYLPLNAFISCTHRNGTEVYASRRVRLTPPDVDEKPTPSGAEVAQVLWDVPGATYTQGDTVAILEIDGHTGVPVPNKYSVGAAEFLSDGAPVIRVQLTGVNRGV